MKTDAKEALSEALSMIYGISEREARGDAADLISRLNAAGFSLVPVLRCDHPQASVRRAKFRYDTPKGKVSGYKEFCLACGLTIGRGLTPQPPAPRTAA